MYVANAMGYYRPDNWDNSASPDNYLFNVVEVRDN